MTGQVPGVAVFCGSRPGHDPALRAAARTLGTGMAALGLRLIYGGGRIGLMGEVADAVLDAGGQVVGVIPDFLTRREVAHPGLTELHITDSMHSRKRLMFDLASAFVVMPGGLGTLDETAEIVTWRQLGLHNKPIYVCNERGWAEPLIGLLRACVEQGFAGPETERLYTVVPSVPALLSRLAGLHVAPVGESARL